MVSKLICLTILVILTVASADNQAKINCIRGKFETSLGDSYTSCYNRRQDLQINRIKMCFTDYMKDNSMVTVANNGQMTVNREKFGKFGQDNSNTPVGAAVKKCYDNAPAGDDIYKEAARASQCVFGKVKATC